MFMIACGIAKLSPAQMTKLHKGLPVRVKSGTAHQVNLPPAQAKKLAKAKANNTGMILSFANGGSLFSDLKSSYETDIPAKYRGPIEELVKQGLIDAGVPIGSGMCRCRSSGCGMCGGRPKKGKGFFDDLVKFPAGVVQGLTMSPDALTDYGKKFSTAGEYVADHLRTGEPMRLPDGRAPMSLQQFQKGDPFAMRAAGLKMPQPRLAVMPPSYRSPSQRGRGTLATLAKHPIAGRHHLVRHHMTGAGKGRKISGAGWQEDLQAFDQWTNAIGDKFVGIAKALDPEGKIGKAATNRVVDEIDPSAKYTRMASEALGNVFDTQGNTEKSSEMPTMSQLVSLMPKKEKKPKQKKQEKPKKKPKQRKQEIVTATEILPSEYSEKAIQAIQPLPVASIASAFEDQLPYQPVTWFGAGVHKGTAQAKAHMDKIRGVKLVKGSQEAKDYMAKLRAMRSKKMSGTALYPAGYSRGKLSGSALYPAGM